MLVRPPTSWSDSCCSSPPGAAVLAVVEGGVGRLVVRLYVRPQSPYQSLEYMASISGLEIGWIGLAAAMSSLVVRLVVVVVVVNVVVVDLVVRTTCAGGLVCVVVASAESVLKTILSAWPNSAAMSSMLTIVPFSRMNTVVSPFTLTTL